eukprot:Partr_v1_DN27910_c1_g1_i3_m11121 putative Lipase (class 3)
MHITDTRRIRQNLSVILLITFLIAIVPSYRPRLSSDFSPSTRRGGFPGFGAIVGSSPLDYGASGLILKSDDAHGALVTGYLKVGAGLQTLFHRGNSSDEFEEDDERGEYYMKQWRAIESRRGQALDDDTDSSSDEDAENLLVKRDLTETPTNELESSDRSDKIISKFFQRPYERLVFALNKLYNKFRVRFLKVTSKSADSAPDVKPVQLDDAQRTKIQLMGTFAAAAYCRKEKVESWTCGYRCYGNENATDRVVVLDYFNMGAARVTGFVIVNHDMRAVLLSFRGSVAIQNFIYDIMFSHLTFNYPGAPKGATVHNGFWKAYEQVKDHLRGIVVKAMQDYPDYDFKITGHSLGGALAVFATLDLRDHLKATIGFNKLVEAYTFGEPRLGNQAFVDFVQGYLDRKEISLKRIISFDDLIPQLPPRWLGYVHHGSEEIWITSSLLLEPISTNSTTTSPSSPPSTPSPPPTTPSIPGDDSSKVALVCTALPEDSTCSNSLPQHLIPTHIFYWAIHFGPWC